MLHAAQAEAHADPSTNSHAQRGGPCVGCVTTKETQSPETKHPFQKSGASHGQAWMRALLHRVKHLELNRSTARLKVKAHDTPTTHGVLDVTQGYYSWLNKTRHTVGHAAR